MSLNQPSQGFNYVPAYQTPGIPWVTSSISTGVQEYNFPYVAQSFLVKNTGSGSLSIAFTRAGLSTGHYLPLTGSEYFAADVRIKKLIISGPIGNSYSVFATLTTIQERCMPTLTGSQALTSSLASGSEAYWNGIG